MAFLVEFGPRTRAAYRRALERFVGALHDTGTHLTDATLVDIETALVRLPPRGPASAALQVAAIRSLYRFLAARGHIPAPTADGLAIPPPPVPSSGAKKLSPGEVEAVRARVGGSWRHRRNRCLVLLQLDVGLTVDEVAELCWVDLDSPGGWLRLGGGEGRRTVYLPGEIHTLMLSLRDPATRPSDPVFVSTPGKALSRRSIHAIVVQVGGEVGIHALGASGRGSRSTPLLRTAKV